MGLLFRYQVEGRRRKFKVPRVERSHEDLERQDSEKAWEKSVGSPHSSVKKEKGGKKTLSYTGGGKGKNRFAKSRV